MAAATATIISIASVAATVIGAGVSAYGQYQSGQTQKAISSYNAANQERQARMQLTALTTQAAIEEQTARQNLALRTAESDTRFKNAQALENQGLTQDAINRENIRKRRLDFARLQGSQRAAIAASGVAEGAGTPLDLLAETAARIQQDAEEQHYVGELQRRTIFSEAEQERLGGKLALVGATLNYNSSVQAAALNRYTADAQYRAGISQAEITRLSGKAAASEGAWKAGSTLLSGASSGYGEYDKYFPRPIKAG